MKKLSGVHETNKTEQHQPKKRRKSHIKRKRARQNSTRQQQRQQQKEEDEEKEEEERRGEEKNKKTTAWPIISETLSAIPHLWFGAWSQFMIPIMVGEKDNRSVHYFREREKERKRDRYEEKERKRILESLLRFSGKLTHLYYQRSLLTKAIYW